MSDTVRTRHSYLVPGVRPVTVCEASASPATDAQSSAPAARYDSAKVQPSGSAPDHESAASVSSRASTVNPVAIASGRTRTRASLLGFVTGSAPGAAMYVTKQRT